MKAVSFTDDTMQAARMCYRRKNDLVLRVMDVKLSKFNVKNMWKYFIMMKRRTWI